MNIIDTRIRAMKSSLNNLMVPVVLLIGLVFVAAVRGPNLFTQDGLSGALVVAAPLILATMALTPIALAGRGGVDLAVGPLIGFINVTFIQWLVGNGVTSPVILCLYAVVAGVIYQLIQGALIVYLRVAPIIVTLSSYLVLSGLNLVILPRPSGVSPEWMWSWGAGTSVFSPITWLLIVAFLLWWIITRTTFFINLKMTGADERTAYTSGVRTDEVRLGAHVISGIFCGFAALAFTALIGSGDPTQGSNYTLTAVTALVLGGTSLAGGRGGALGSILGAINMYLISYVLSTYDFGAVSGFVTQMSYGVILVVSLLGSIAISNYIRVNKGFSGEKS